RASTQSF
ncbi:molybdopterin dinucleotide binding domain protein, partial [Vibrio parahaemolyticus V-223/04]